MPNILVTIAQSLGDDAIVPVVSAALIAQAVSRGEPEAGQVLDLSEQAVRDQAVANNDNAEELLTMQKSIKAQLTQGVLRVANGV